METCYFTILTPTFNRAHTLERVYHSLNRQTFTSFEWLVVDDGSTDGTRTLISRLTKRASFPIRYFYKENGGKHTAMNLGFKNSFGKLIIVFDSDDWCVSTALEKIAAMWDGLSEQERNHHSGVSVLKVYTNGTVVGDRHPRNPELKTYVDRFNRHITGDKWEIFRRDLCQEYLYPEIKGEKYLAPSLPWLMMGERYKTIFSNQKLLIGDYLEDGISKQNILYRSSSPKGCCRVYENRFNISRNMYRKLESIINLHRFFFHGGPLINHGGYSIVGVIFGFFCYCYDLIAIKKIRRRMTTDRKNMDHTL